MPAYVYQTILWECISAFDSGKFDDLNIESVKEHARSGTISKFLKEQFADADFSIISTDAWNDVDRMASVLTDDSFVRRKLAVENRGLSLLMAFALASMQNERRLETKNAHAK